MPYTVKSAAGRLLGCAFFRRQLAQRLGVPQVRLLWAETQEAVPEAEWP
jgi:hypothetical protein